MDRFIVYNIDAEKAVTIQGERLNVTYIGNFSTVGLKVGLPISKGQFLFLSNSGCGASPLHLTIGTDIRIWNRTDILRYLNVAQGL
ncbi:hypothetical protein [Deminuibacter soli]|uniref:hypothetical protein n=1 Tax=Deminuibacter soli TaxID=2291815 RepID=UPI0011C0EC17|nr:hypothetical protein [Deminuibacter soli]